MTVETKVHEYIQSMAKVMDLDRSRKRWRLFAIFSFLLVLVWWSGYISSNSIKEPYIAQINIHGMITQNLEIEDTLDKIANNENIKAVIMHVDSPGGTMVGGLSLYKAIERIKNKKPIVAVMGSTAASAGYLISLAANYIFANEATATGSIGVLIPLIDVSDLAGRIGIKSNFIASGDLKTAGLPLEKTSEKAKQYLQSLVNDMEKIFVAYLTKHRKISPQTLALVKDGRAIIGYQAKQLNLIDDLGGIFEARKWLEKNHSINIKTPVIYTKLEEEKPFLEQVLGEAHIFSKKIVSSLLTSGI